MAKKDPFRFSLRLNPKDPRHREVAEILNMQGRGAANLMVNAISHYLKCDKQVAASVDKEDIFLQKIQHMLEEVLEEKLQNLSIATHPSNPPPQADIPSDLDAGDMRDIADCLDDFFM